MSGETVSSSDVSTPFRMPADDYYSLKRVVHSSEFIKSSRDIKLFTQSWRPATEKPKALLFMCHGYGNDSSWLFQVNAVEFAAEGFAVFTLDYEGHGQSEGLRCGVRKFDHLVDGCYLHFKAMKEKSELQGLPTFIYGESLGGAVAIKVCKKDPMLCNGAVLASPMVKIADQMRPHWTVAAILEALAVVIPDAAIVPTTPLLKNSFRDPEKLEVALANPRRYPGRPRLGFSLELLNVTRELAATMEEIDFPFLIIHGEDDVVTDPVTSKELFERSTSPDKTLKIYPEGWHQLLVGEPKEAADVIRRDVLGWLDERVERAK